MQALTPPLPIINVLLRGLRHNAAGFIHPLFYETKHIRSSLFRRGTPQRYDTCIALLGAY
jgi:hypothetical protein